MSQPKRSPGACERNDSVDRFMPKWDLRKEHETIVRAPAKVVFEVAQHFNLESIPLIRAIFWLRAKLLRASYSPMTRGIVEETMSMGWRMLDCLADRELIMGSATQPWIGRVTFRGIPPEKFPDFNEPDYVKIVWTFEAEPLGSDLTRLRTQTRVLATDAQARAKFKSYWRKFGIGIRIIRWLALPSIRREAERRHTLSDNRGSQNPPPSSMSALEDGTKL